MNIAAACLQHALATQPAVQAWINGPVNKIFFPVVQFFQVIFAFFNVNMAGAAGANAAAIVVQFYIIGEGYFKYRVAGLLAADRNRFQAFLFKFKMNIVHNGERVAQIGLQK